MGLPFTAGAAQEAGRVPVPDVSAPATGGTRGQPFGALTSKDLPAGFIEEERFISGTATSYSKAGTWGADGRLERHACCDRAVQSPHARAPALRRRRFNGIVVVEWLNVTAHAEGAADFMQMQEEIVRDGYAWVGVGAQAAGVNSPRHRTEGLGRDALRIARPSRRRVLVRHLLAGGRRRCGIRQASTRSAACASARCSRPADRNRRFGSSPTSTPFHPLTHLFDGYLVHSRGGNAVGSAGGSAWRATPTNPIAAGAHIRTDIDVPVLDLQTEGDMVALRAHLTRQDADPHYRRWEIAGAAHAETPRWVVEVPPALDMGPGLQGRR